MNEICEDGAIYCYLFMQIIPYPNSYALTEIEHL